MAASLLRPLILLALTTIGGCAQIEFYRLQGEVEDLREQLEYEKQRLKQANEQADSNPNQPVKQRTSAKACKPQKRIAWKLVHPTAYRAEKS
jgi:cell division septum initiation protein DivIVA